VAQWELEALYGSAVSLTGPLPTISLDGCTHWSGRADPEGDLYAVAAVRRTDGLVWRVYKLDSVGGRGRR